MYTCRYVSMHMWRYCSTPKQLAGDSLFVACVMAVPLLQLAIGYPVAQADLACLLSCVVGVQLHPFMWAVQSVLSKMPWQAALEILHLVWYVAGWAGVLIPCLALTRGLACFWMDECWHWLRGNQVARSTLEQRKVAMLSLATSSWLPFCSSRIGRGPGR